MALGRGDREWLLLILVSGTLAVTGLVSGTLVETDLGPSFPAPGTYWLEGCNSRTQAYTLQAAAEDNTGTVQVSMTLASGECFWGIIWPTVEGIKERSPLRLFLRASRLENLLSPAQAVNLDFSVLLNEEIDNSPVRGFSIRSDGLGMAYIKLNEKAKPVEGNVGSQHPLEARGNYNGTYMCIWDEVFRMQLEFHRIRSLHVPLCSDKTYSTPDSKIKPVASVPKNSAASVPKNSGFIVQFWIRKPRGKAAYVRVHEKDGWLVDKVKKLQASRTSEHPTGTIVLGADLKHYLSKHEMILVASSEGITLMVEPLQPANLKENELKRVSIFIIDYKGKVYRKLSNNPDNLDTRDPSLDGYTEFCTISNRGHTATNMCNTSRGFTLEEQPRPSHPELPSGLHA